MGAFFRGDITLRKLRVLADGLPQAGPHTRHTTNGIEYTYTDSLLWALMWGLMQNTVTTAQAAGSKKAKMPADQMPPYPWALQDKKQALGGSLGDHTQEEVLDFLDSL
ncbi:hypothetical protein [Corynebacterium pseudopelargi]|uniref:hypothetical protein n=1 Tax=Corynebacterium pseudopelargi TaxID=2080757 RepID=UPI000F512858|nr:hypothetical protein [Corynebacterium pseudopelargi]